MDANLDGIHSLLPRDRMTISARILRDIYAHVPGAPFLRREFGFYSLDKWKSEGHISDTSAENLCREFLLDPPGNHRLGRIGWCEAAFSPEFEEKIIEDRGDYEVVQDRAGRHVLCFRGRRSGFMPEYLDHPVKDRKTWEENVKWRLDPNTPARYGDPDPTRQGTPAAQFSPPVGAQAAGLKARMLEAKSQAARGLMIVQDVVGGYMYLRSLIGPISLCYALYDMQDVIHDCMATWLRLADHVTAVHQQHVTIDELFFGEDICYNHGLLISPDMVKEFIFPYYQQLITNMKSRQIDKSRHLYVQVDTDGDCRPAIPLYHEAIGLDVMSPFEVASGGDVVQIARQYPDLVMFGGIDKRVLASGRPGITRHLQHILPAMRVRGGFIPTCDHGVPEEVPFEDYRYYRLRCVELGG